MVVYEIGREREKKRKKKKENAPKLATGELNSQGSRVSIFVYNKSRFEYHETKEQVSSVSLSLSLSLSLSARAHDCSPG